MENNTKVREWKRESLDVLISAVRLSVCMSVCLLKQINTVVTKLFRLTTRSPYVSKLPILILSSVQLLTY
jgi:hypothetical protein